MRTAEEKLKFITEYSEKLGIKFTVERNPSNEMLESLKNSFKEKDGIVEAITFLSNRKKLGKA